MSRRLSVPTRFGVGLVVVSVLFFSCCFLNFFRERRSRALDMPTVVAVQHLTSTHMRFRVSTRNQLRNVRLSRAIDSSSLRSTRGAPLHATAARLTAQFHRLLKPAAAAHGDSSAHARGAFCKKKLRLIQQTNCYVQSTVQ
jgi:hypothetical protein